MGLTGPRIGPPRHLQGSREEMLTALQAAIEELRAVPGDVGAAEGADGGSP